MMRSVIHQIILFCTEEITINSKNEINLSAHSDHKCIDQVCVGGTHRMKERPPGIRSELLYYDSWE